MATSNSRSALDTWLSDANDLLSEQRAHSISPSSQTVKGADDPYRSTRTMGDVDAELETLLARLTATPGRWILVINDASRPCRYVQFLAYEDASMISEVASNYYLDECCDGRHGWTVKQQRTLTALGWQRPDPPGRPNWTDVWPVYSPPVGIVADRALRTFRGVFQLRADDTVDVKLFSFSEPGKDAGE
jgi:hypothetical protein